MQSGEIIIKNHVKSPTAASKKSILVHSCCAPCAAGCLDRLCAVFNVTLYFYNPNIDTHEEYSKRAEELKKLASHFAIREVIIEDYKKEEFLAAAKGLEGEREGGARCSECFALRLCKTAHMCKERKFDYFCTTLTLSPHKNAARINEIGAEAAKQYGVAYLESDFKKQNGLLASRRCCEELNIYRQNYCGCEFSRR